MNLKIDVKIDDNYNNKIDINLNSPRIKFKPSPEEENELDMNESCDYPIESSKQMQKAQDSLNSNQSPEIIMKDQNQQYLDMPTSHRQLNKEEQNPLDTPIKLQNIDVEENIVNDNSQNKQQEENDEENRQKMNSSTIKRIAAIKKRQQSQTKRKKIKVVFTTFFKVIFHYVDSLTDIFLIREYIELSAGETDNFQALLYYGVCTMNLLICYGADRLFSYLFLVQMKQTEDNLTLSQLKNSSKIEREQAVSSTNIGRSKSSKSIKEIVQLKDISRKEKLKCFCITITLSDYLYILFNETKNPDEMQLKLIKKSLIELICENFMFLFGSTQLYIFKYIQGVEHGFMDYLAILTSLLSSCYVIYSMANLRYQEEPFILERDEKKFSEMSVDTQRYVSNPYIIAHFKQIGPEKFKYEEITILESEMANSEVHRPLGICKKLQIIFIVMNEMFAMVIFFNLQNGVESMIGSYLRFAQGWMAAVPQCIVYLSTFTAAKQKKFLEEQEEKGETISTRQKNLNFKTEFFKLLAASPYLYIVGAIQFRFPLFMQCFPLMKQIKENWILNFNPHIYVVLFRLLAQWYDLWSVYVIMTEKIVHSQMQSFYTDEDIRLRIHSPDTMLWDLFYLGLFCQCLSTVYNCIDLVLRKIRTQQKMQNRNKQQSEVLSQASGAISTGREKKIEIQE